MKRMSFLFIFAFLLSTSCGNDDGPGTGGPIGDLFLRLDWDRADVDLDLQLMGPDGIELTPNFSAGVGIHSGNAQAGPGEETITFDNNAPNGSYTAVVRWVAGDGDIIYNYLIESSTAIRGQNNQPIDSVTNVVTYTFTKSGAALIF